MPRDKHLWVPTTDGAVDGYFDGDGASKVSAVWHTWARYQKSRDPEDLAPLERLTIPGFDIISDPELFDAYDESGEWDVVDETIYVETPK